MPSAHVRADAGRHRRAEHLKKFALHEAGHAAAWHFGGGTVERVTIIPEGCQLGLCTYVLPEAPSAEDRLRQARSGLAGPLICEFAGDPETIDWPHDYEAAVHALRPLHKSRRGLCHALALCWLDTVELSAAPRCGALLLRSEFAYSNAALSTASPLIA
jgi:hypothetical protein